MNEQEVSAKLDALIEVNRDIRQWLRILAWETASETVTEALGDEPANFELYEALDGETSIGDVIDDTRLPRRTVYNRLEDWQRVGIISRVGRGIYEKIAPIDSLAVEPPSQR